MINKRIITYNNNLILHIDYVKKEYHIENNAKIKDLKETIEELQKEDFKEA